MAAPPQGSVSSTSSSADMGPPRAVSADLPSGSARFPPCPSVSSLCDGVRLLSPTAADALVKVSYNSPALLRHMPAAAISALAHGDEALHSAICSAVITAKQWSDQQSDSPHFSLPVPEQGTLPFAAFAASCSPCWLSPLEIYAAGFPISAGSVVLFFSHTFEESKTIEGLNRCRPLANKLYSFEERCLASGCPHLLPRWDLDENSPFFGSPRWEGAPLKRICLGRSALQGELPSSSPAQCSPLHPAWRLPVLLGIEAGLRMQLAL